MINCPEFPESFPEFLGGQNKIARFFVFLRALFGDRKFDMK